MYKISVPVMNANAIRSGRERLVEELHRLDAERVFLAMDTYELDPKKQKETFETLRENVQYFKKQGFEVVSVSELIYNEDYYVDNNGVQHKTS